MLLLDLIISGQISMLISGTGYVAGHMYLFFDELYPEVVGGNTKVISTPRYLKSLFPSPAESNVQNTGFGTAFKPTKHNSKNSDTPASTSGFSRFGFSSPFQGKGRRLGD